MPTPLAICCALANGNALTLVRRSRQALDKTLWEKLRGYKVNDDDDNGDATTPSQTVLPHKYLWQSRHGPFFHPSPATPGRHDCLKERPPTSTRGIHGRMVCAVFVELAAAPEMLDQEYETLHHDTNDNKIYALRRIGEHKVVVAMQTKSAFKLIRV